MKPQSPPPESPRDRMLRMAGLEECDDCLWWYRATKAARHFHIRRCMG